MPLAITRILVAVDFSAQSDAAVAYARAIAGPFGASLDLLHVIEDLEGQPDWVTDLYLKEMTAMREQAIAEAEGRLAHRATALGLDGIESRAHVVVGRPAAAIVHAAATHACDMIVMGTHGRSGLPHLFMGSVAEKVVRMAACPVLTVRADGAVPADVRDAAIAAETFASAQRQQRLAMAEG